MNRGTSTWCISFVLQRSLKMICINPMQPIQCPMGHWSDMRNGFKFGPRMVNTVTGGYFATRKLFDV